MSKHTPGPWIVSPLDPAVVGFIYDVVLPETGSRLPRFGGVARVLNREGETEANARLIAAAPELLRELKHLLALLEPYEDKLDLPGLATLNGPRAAIAKAEGK